MTATAGLTIEPDSRERLTKSADRHPQPQRGSGARGRLEVHGHRARLRGAARATSLTPWCGSRISPATARAHEFASTTPTTETSRGRNGDLHRGRGFAPLVRPAQPLRASPDPHRAGFFPNRRTAVECFTEPGLRLTPASRAVAFRKLLSTATTGCVFRVCGSGCHGLVVGFAFSIQTTSGHGSSIRGSVEYNTIP